MPECRFCITRLYYMVADDLLKFCRAIWRTDAVLQIADAYKWLVQATQGGEHALGSRAALWERLEREWKELTAPLPGEPLIEPLRPDGAIVRVHLRPFRAAGGQPAALLDAFYAGAAAWFPDPALLRTTWSHLGISLQARDQGHLSHAAWVALDTRLAQQGYPAISHSPHYTTHRRPAYRVLTDAACRSLLDQLVTTSR